LSYTTTRDVLTASHNPKTPSNNKANEGINNSWSKANNQAIVAKDPTVDATKNDCKINIL